MKRLAQHLGLRVDPTIFFISAGLSLIFVVLISGWLMLQRVGLPA